MRTMQDEIVDHAGWLWSKSVVLPDTLGLRPVLGWEPLPPAWLSQRKNFLDARASEAYLRTFSGSTSAMLALGRAFASLHPGKLQALAKDDLIVAVGAALTRGQAWVIELAKDTNLPAGQTDPAVFSSLNLKFGTKIDFASVSVYEGGQLLRGYVPFHKNGIVIGKSGMTIATGFDIGQWGRDEIIGRGKSKGMDLPQALLDQILPYAYPNYFEGLTKAQVVAQVGMLGPVPTLKGHKNWADQCDAVVFKTLLVRARDKWDNNIGAGVPGFLSLPGGWQTVWLSRLVQGRSGLFENLAKVGKWGQAVTALRHEPGYKSRTDQEADLVAAELPAPVKVPSAQKGAIGGTDVNSKIENDKD